MSESTNNAVAAVAAGAQAGLYTKLAFMFGAGLLGAAIMAAFDPPTNRKDLFKQAACAGIGSMMFGGPAVRVIDYYFDFIDLTNALPEAYFEWAIPVYFTVGALSWGAFAAMAKLRGFIRDRGAATFAKKFLEPEEKDQP